MDSCGVVIIGGGIVGSALAAVLAQDGHRVTVIERSMKPPDRIQGEIMQPGGMAALQQLGLQDCLEDIGCVTLTGFVFHGIDGLDVPFHFKPGTRGFSLRNGNFMDKLRKRAQEEPNCTFIEASVMDVIEEADTIKGVIYKRKGATETESLRAALTVNCQGVYSPLRKVNMADGKISKYGAMVAIECPISKPQHSLIQPDPTVEAGESYVFPFVHTQMGMCYVNHINDHTLRMGVIVRGDEFPADLKAYMKKEYSYAPDSIREAFMEVIDDVVLMKGLGFVLSAKATFKPGFITLGDALNIRHPITGAGMTIGLKDIELWRQLLHDIPSLDDFIAMQHAHKTFLKKRKAYCLVVNLLAGIMHETMIPLNEEAVMLRNLAMDYMRWNPQGRDDLTKILTIVDTRPSVLFYQLALLTIYTAARIVSSEPWWKIPKGVMNAFKYVYTSVKVLVPLIWAEAT